MVDTREPAVLNPAGGAVLKELQSLTHEVRMLRLAQTMREEEGPTIHKTPFSTSLKLQVVKWQVFPAVLTNFALLVGTNRVATVRASAGAIVVELPITIEQGTNVSVIDAATGVVVDGNAAVLLDSYLTAFIDRASAPTPGGDNLSV